MGTCVTPPRIFRQINTCTVFIIRGFLRIVFIIRGFLRGSNCIYRVVFSFPRGPILNCFRMCGTSRLWKEQIRWSRSKDAFGNSSSRYNAPIDALEKLHGDRHRCTRKVRGSGMEALIIQVSVTHEIVLFAGKIEQLQLSGDPARSSDIDASGDDLSPRFSNESQRQYFFFLSRPTDLHRSTFSSRHCST